MIAVGFSCYQAMWPWHAAMASAQSSPALQASQIRSSAPVLLNHWAQERQRLGARPPWSGRLRSALALV